MLTKEQQETAVRLRHKGRTYREIGEAIGVSHETARAAVTAAVPAGDSVLDSVRVTARAQRVSEISEWIRENGPVPRSQVMEKYGMTTVQLAALMPELPAHLVIYDGKNRVDQYSDADIMAAIRRVWAELQTADATAKGLSHVVYEKLRRTDEPSSARILVRAGSWRAACVDAGVPPGARNRPADSYGSKWDDEAILDAVAAFLVECERDAVRPTYARYDAWQQRDPGLPSGSLVRNRMRSVGLPGWAEITLAAAARRAAA